MMEANNIIIIKHEDSSKEFTYVFDYCEKNQREMAGNGVFPKFRYRIYQIIPSICGSLICVIFGITLGWPSPTYPYLLSENSTIPITMDQSAMIAGFLMLGNSIGTPFSSIDYLGAKYGIILAITLMLIGWILMWQATTIYWILASRLIVGLGNGYGGGQIRIYIKEICETSLIPILLKQINLYIYFGIIVAYLIGIFVDFQRFSLITVIISVFILFLTLFLPSTPKELLKSGKLIEAKKLLLFLKPYVNENDEITKIREEINKKNADLNLIDLLKLSSIIRWNFLIFLILVFCQQFSGLPATIIYSQIIFNLSHCPYPEYCALLYVCIFFVANIYGIFYSSKFNKKLMLILSSFSVCLVLIAKIIIIYCNLNDYFFNYLSLIVMLLYLIFNTIGLSNIPFTLISDYFPINCHRIIIQIFIILYSMLALIITKIFQVLIDNYDLYVPFCLFLAISVFCLIFVIFFVPKEATKNIQLTNFK